MQVFSDIPSLKGQIHHLRQKGLTIAFVPTMGNLHDGHLTLVKKAKQQADIVVVSIFVNPMQFERSDDLNNYPRTLEDDLNKLEHEKVELVFTPTPEIMYPEGLNKQTFVEVPTLSHILEGASRPGHFRGVTTIVTKLFNIVQPDVACFGEKDFQQLAIIRQMNDDLCMGIKIIGVPTVRESDGLAMSSRNGLLTKDERQRAPIIAQTMRWIAHQILERKSDIDSIIKDATEQLKVAHFRPDDIFIRDAKTLQAISNETTQVVILISAFLGKTRLIDNQMLDLAIDRETVE